MWWLHRHGMVPDPVADLRPRVALTFDAEHPEGAGGDPDAGVDEILSELSRSRARATFFLQGRWVEAYPGAARRIADEGHLIGSHSHYHADLRLLTPAGFRADLCRGERAIRHVCATDPRPWFRCPFGGPDPRSAALLAAHGYRHVGWNVDGGDDREGAGAGSAAEVEAAVMRGLADHPETAVVRLHAWSRSGRVALAGILRGLDALDAHLVTVAEVIAEDVPPHGRRPAHAGR